MLFNVLNHSAFVIESRPCWDLTLSQQVLLPKSVQKSHRTHQNFSLRAEGTSAMSNFRGTGDQNQNCFGEQTHKSCPPHNGCVVMAVGRHLASVLGESMETIMRLLHVFHVYPWAMRFSAIALSPTYQSWDVLRLLFSGSGKMILSQSHIPGPRWVGLSFSFQFTNFLSSGGLWEFICF